MQYWPRVKAKKPLARIRSWSTSAKDPVLGFIGYKVGMTHIIGIDSKKSSITKGEEISVPVTVIECPPMRIAGIRFYKKVYGKVQPFKDIIFKIDKFLPRKTNTPKKLHDLASLDAVNLADIFDVKLLAFTQPSLAGIPKKKPEFIEFGMSGTPADKIKFIKDHHDKELTINSLFKEGEYVDLHSVTKGKGLQGPIKRFGVERKSHKTEKGVRRVGTLGSWSGQGHTLYRVPHPGQMGYHMRSEYNKQIFKISSKPEEINPKGAFLHYGNVKSSFILIKGSVSGSQKRAVILTKSTRQKVVDSAPTINYISLESKQ
jgi:large subunit ribosomal protein L3